MNRPRALPSQPREHAVPCRMCPTAMGSRGPEFRMTYNTSGLCDEHEAGSTYGRVNLEDK